MLIQFDELSQSVLDHFNSGEGRLIAKIFNDGTNKILQGMLEPGSTVGLHTHTGTSETIFILSGTGKVLYDGVYETIQAGSCHYCPEGHAHSLINDSEGDLHFVAVVPKHPV